MPIKGGKDKKMKTINGDITRVAKKPNITLFASYNIAADKTLTRKIKTISMVDKKGLTYKHCRTIEAILKDQPKIIRTAVTVFIIAHLKGISLFSDLRFWRKNS